MAVCVCEQREAHFCCCSSFPRGDEGWYVRYEVVRLWHHIMILLLINLDSRDFENLTEFPFFAF